MDKNSIIGLVLVGAILFGFSWYQSKQMKERQAAVMREDSLARVQLMEQMALDSLKKLQNPGSAAQTIKVQPARQAVSPVYKDENLNSATKAVEEKVKLSNDKIELVLTTKGAQPYSVLIKDYFAFGGDPLQLVKPGWSDFGIGIYAGEAINTRDFTFRLVSHTDTSAVMVLPFSNGGFIRQTYTLPRGSYMVYDNLEFCGMNGVIPKNVTMYDIDWTLKMPRLEKGFKNEQQYSKLDVYCPGESKPELVGKTGRGGDKRFDTRLDWFDFNQQFFSAIMTAPDGGFSSGVFSLSFAGENDPDKALMTCSARLRNEFNMQGGSAGTKYEFYFGPNNYRTLKSYDRKYDKVITIGGNVIGLITRFVIIPCFEILSKVIHNYGVIILVMTLLLKLVLSPLTIKSYMSSAKMNALRPEIDKLNDKFPKANEDRNQAMKKQQATMDLYKRAGINPMGGCLPMLLQLPILWAMFRFFPASIELRQQSFLWAEDLSAYDSILDFGFRFLGLDHLSLFALLMAVSMLFYSLMTMPRSNDPQMKPMRFMSIYFMPIMMFFICNGLSSALSYYYLLSNIITMIQTFVIKKWFVNPEKLLAQIEANKNKPVTKSKWQLRLEAAQKAAEQQQRNAYRRK